MRESKTLAKLRAGKTVRIAGLGHWLPAFVRHAAHVGYDCIWLDLEHRNMDSREVQSLMAFFHLFDIDCMVRPPTLQKTELYRYLEDGASGLMIPMVSTPEKAQMLVDAVKFPPLGGRGLDGAGLDTDFALQGGPEYTDLANRETFLVVQIETPEGVENVDAIAAVDGVDAVFIGPADLGLRYRKMPDSDMTVEKATKNVAAAAARHGKAWGRPAPSLEDLKTLHAQGARMLAHGGDFPAVMAALEAGVNDFNEAGAE